jgi:hypothetical protein
MRAATLSFLSLLAGLTDPLYGSRPGASTKAERIGRPLFLPRRVVSAFIDRYRLPRLGSQRSGASAPVLPELQLIPVRIVAPGAGAAPAPIDQIIRLKANPIGLQTVMDGQRIRDQETGDETYYSAGTYSVQMPALSAFDEVLTPR